jgi:hypothetical protein
MLRGVPAWLQESTSPVSVSPFRNGPAPTAVIESIVRMPVVSEAWICSTLHGVVPAHGLPLINVWKCGCLVRCPGRCPISGCQMCQAVWATGRSNDDDLEDNRDRADGGGRARHDRDGQLDGGHHRDHVVEQIWISVSLLIWRHVARARTGQLRVPVASLAN